MVNNGKPSRGCLSCRERKIKCDQKRPACNQCLRVLKQCPGYPNALDLMFKHENETVAKKARARYQKASKPRVLRQVRVRSCEVPNPAPTPEPIPVEVPIRPHLTVIEPSHVANVPQFGNDYRDIAESVSSPSWMLTPPIEDQATNFFYTHYIAGHTEAPRAHFDYLPKLLFSPDIDKTLEASFHAVGLACFSNTFRTPQLTRRAREQYVSALSMINAALSCPEMATKDSTLASVLLLGMYENLAYTRPRSFEYWTNHINGAATLIRLRGTEQLRSPIGLRIFQQFYGNIILGCLRNKIPVPPDIMDLWEESNKVEFVPAGWYFTKCMLPFIELLVGIKNRRIDQPASIMSAAMKIDGELEDLVSDMPEICKYQTVYSASRPEMAYDGYYHVYQNLWTPQVLNNFRVVRIILNEVIREQFMKVPTASPLNSIAAERDIRLRTATDNIKRLSSDVCATVAQIAGYVPFPGPQHRDSSSIPDLDPSLGIEPERYPILPRPQTPTSASYSGSFYLVWPLYTVGSMPICSAPLRRWVMNHLYCIGRTIGIQQAVVMADALKQVNGSR